MNEYHLKCMFTLIERAFQPRATRQELELADLLLDSIKLEVSVTLAAQEEARKKMIKLVKG
jgi:hypothetical protein